MLAAVHFAFSVPPGDAPGVIIVAPTAAAAVEAYDLAMSVTAVAPEAARAVACCTESAKFADDVALLSGSAGGSAPPCVVIGSLRRVADLVKRGALRATSLQSFMVAGADDILSAPSEVQRIRSIMTYIDHDRVQIAATGTDEARTQLEGFFTEFAQEWTWWNSSATH